MDRSIEKKTAPVSMSKLLSFGYIEDEKKSTNEDDCSSTTDLLCLIVFDRLSLDKYFWRN